jgi:hypothetical protein
MRSSLPQVPTVEEEKFVSSPLRLPFRHPVAITGRSPLLAHHVSRMQSFMSTVSNDG